MPENLLKGRAGKAPFIEPFLRALDRIQGETALGSDQLLERAATLLSSISKDEVPPVSGFAYGPTGIIGSHTHYFEGFAILLSLPFGTAVAAHAVDEGPSEVVFEGTDRVWQFSLTHGSRASTDHPIWIRIVEDIFRTLAPDVAGVRIAISTTIFPQSFDAYVAALGAAVSDVAIKLGNESVDSRRRILAVKEVVERHTGQPFGATYLIAAIHGDARYLLVDGRTHEFLPVEAPARDEIGWGMIHLDDSEAPAVDTDSGNKEKADEAVICLREKAFPNLTSLRELEHRDLQRALSVLPLHLKPLVRHLVTENRRVQKVVMALRKRDWQFLGALLVMSHASLRTDWKSTGERQDLIVEQAEQMSIDGVFGAAMTSRGGTVLVCGQPFVVPQFFDRVSDVYHDRFGAVPKSILLPDGNADPS